MIPVSVASSGCVDRVIHEGEVVADGEGGLVETDTDTDTDPSDSSQISTTTEDDPDVECHEPEDCGDGQTCYQGVCVGTGNVRISLSWTVVTDLDLHVYVPN